MFKLAKKFRISLKKNMPEATALLMGKMPSFIYGARKFHDIPVFCFHSAKYPLFESQLFYLKKNGFKTLSADELYERQLDKHYKNNGKEIVLTFDDGMSSVWTVAFPLLQKYEQKIISFILPGLITEGKEVSGHIDEENDVQENIALAHRDYLDYPLCNWKEIDIMHESGLVDIQSHGMRHELISISPEVVDFIHPEFDTYHYGNIHIPIYENNEGDICRDKILGHPVYRSLPRLSGESRYLDPIDVRNYCHEFVLEQGGIQFFENEKWRFKLQSAMREYKQISDVAIYESDDLVEEKIVQELSESKSAIEKRLNKNVNHFCFPWFIGSERSVRLLKKVGYLSAHMGGNIRQKKCIGDLGILLVGRIQEEFLMYLPGIGRVGFRDIINYKKSGTYSKLSLPELSD